MPTPDRIVIRGGIAAVPLLLAAALLTGCSDDGDCDDRAGTSTAAADDIALMAAPERVSGGSGGRSGGSGGSGGSGSTSHGGGSHDNCDD
ncbi:hypothetical protein [Streptomyces sp. NBC_01803]|uniref:hypothetical protein n=1 Tax=Streptomyces sp. NBC_01803 TaxID=2975946 RepID=UPI002DD8D2E2|nr:hypothetical protein [Streptomyces sp. NBC_01803]WSA45188.1 hypothetical protein OIE51_13810 [Streptomyces sp. NBC_01803]